MWQAADRAADAVALAAARLAGGATRAATWLGAGRAAVLAAGRRRRGRRWPSWSRRPSRAGTCPRPSAALLVLLPLALARGGRVRWPTPAPWPPAPAPPRRASTSSRRATRPCADPRDAGAARTGRTRRTWPGVASARRGRTARRCDDLALSCRPGRGSASSARPGRGKSTLAALLLRFVDPVHGVGASSAGVPLRRLALDDVRRTVGLVDDDPHVFATTLVENVRLARPGATDAEVEAALRRARLGPWLDALPGRPRHAGSATGTPQVSGGERARIGRRPLAAGRPAGAGARRADRPPRPRHGGGAGRARSSARRRARTRRVDHPRAARSGPRRPGRRPDRRATCDASGVANGRVTPMTTARTHPRLPARRPRGRAPGPARPARDRGRHRGRRGVRLRRGGRRTGSRRCTPTWRCSTAGSPTARGSRCAARSGPSTPRSGR